MIDYAIALRPKTSLDRCGDLAVVQEFDGNVFIGVVDVLGSGRNAHKIATRCKSYLNVHFRQQLKDIMSGLDALMRGGIGAVVGLAFVNGESGLMKYMGIGDIGARKYGVESQTFNSSPGIVGYRMATPKETSTKLHNRDMLLISTDGIRSHFNQEDYPLLFSGNAQMVADRVVSELGKETDDVACVVLKYER